MAESNWYEVRPRGDFMLLGNMVKAKSFDQVFSETDRHTEGYIIIDNAGNWLLSSWNTILNTRAVMTVMATENSLITAKEHDPIKRLAFAKACEAICQSGEKNPSLEFADFDNQVEKFEEERAEYRSTYKKTDNTQRETAKRESIINATECIKECIAAEMAIVQGAKENANRAMRIANHKLNVATNLAKASHTPGDTKSNSADRTVAIAKKQYDETNKDFRNFKSTLPARNAIPARNIPEECKNSGLEGI